MVIKNDRINMVIIFMKHIILANPVSGNKKGVKRSIAIQKLLKKNGIDAKIIISKFPKYLTNVSREYSQKEKCRFYVLGGDGSLNEVICGIIGSDSEVVVIPCGTGNDFIKSISKYMSMRKIINSSINTPATPTDVMKLNKDMYCINILNCGFDALVAKNVDKFRNIPFISGKAKYNLSIFYTLMTNRNYKFKIRINNEVIKGSFTLATICNGKYYGGGISPCPDANVVDGTLDVCLIDSTKVRQKIIFLPKYSKSKHIGLKQVHIFKTDSIHIVSNQNFPISIDGEVIYSNKLLVKVLPKAVNIVHIN